jgi:uncharacterized protein with PIN domain
MEKAKLFIDEDVHDRLASVLRSLGYDAINARESKRKGKTDIEQLQFAISQGRLIFSFEKLAIEFFKNRIEHFGIIVSPQRSFTETLSRLVKVLNEIPVADFKNQLIYI